MIKLLFTYCFPIIRFGRAVSSSSSCTSSHLLGSNLLILDSSRSSQLPKAAFLYIRSELRVGDCPCKKNNVLLLNTQEFSFCQLWRRSRWWTLVVECSPSSPPSQTGARWVERAASKLVSLLLGLAFGNNVCPIDPPCLLISPTSQTGARWVERAASKLQSALYIVGPTVVYVLVCLLN